MPQEHIPDCVVIDYDSDPDLSWVDEDDTRPRATLEMIAYTENGTVADSLCNIDFYEDGDDWVTGTFYRIRAIPERCEYLREIARGMKLPE